MNKKRTDVDKLAAAYLAGNDGKTQAEIAGILGLSQTVVSRLLGETKDRFWRHRLEFIADEVDDATFQAVLQRIGKNKLAEALSSLANEGTGPVRRGPVLTVFGGGGKNVSDRERMSEFGRRAAAHVRNLVIASRTCGLTWGSMLWHIIQGIRALRFQPPWSATPIQFIPLAGEPLGDTPTRFSSSSLVSELGRAANGDEYHAQSLAMVPAFIPEGFSQAELDGVWKLIRLVPSYNEIFGDGDLERPAPESPVAERLDMILTSVGPAQQVLGFVTGRLFETGKVTIDRLQELVIGDMGGVCFPRPGLNSEQTKDLDSVEARWTGLRRSHLLACAANAVADPSRPGVVVISGGVARARFIYDVVRLGVINHLVVDDVLASELSRMLGVSLR